MKSKLNTVLLLGGAMLAVPLVGRAQHSHLNVGATGQNQGDPLIFANGGDFNTTSGFTLALTYTNAATYAGYYQGGLTLTALPDTAANAGPDPQASALGSYVQFSIIKATGPIGGRFGFWETGATAPSLSLLAGDHSDQLFPLSQGDGSPESDPFGHIHGRRFTATKPGVYTAWFKAFDTSSNGANGGPIHSPSDPLTLRIVAGEPTLLTAVAMGGGMVHANIHYTAAQGGQLDVHVDSGMPMLTPLAISQPDTQFAPTLPWFEELDPSLAGRAFNRQYGFLPDPTSDPLPTGYGLRIRQLSATPGLKAYTYRENPATWEPMFGTDGSSDTFDWSLVMFHPAYTVPAGATGPFSASYEAILVDDQGQPTGITAPFTLNWNVATGLAAGSLAVEPGIIHVPVSAPSTWSGYTYRLERTADFKTWTAVDELTAPNPGNLDLHDESPPAHHAIYRVRPYLP
ncbi:hypothetical protein GC207_10185 [bacterium]|nr:hypothetical protein [bacterium]